MSFTVRCKLYVSSVEIRRQEYMTGPEAVPYVTVHFNAVKSTQEGTENHAYWTASPNGGLKLSGKLEELEQYTPGTYWYIDLTLIDWDLRGCNIMLAKEDIKTKYREKLLEPNIWQLRSMDTYQDLSQLSVKLGMSRGWWEVNGEFNVSIQNSKVWSQYKTLGDLYEMKITQTTKE